jgi:BirA family biotin operon repressor/biotin-[acetyl-CoA-carboxylase] ligase
MQTDVHHGLLGVLMPDLRPQPLPDDLAAPLARVAGRLGLIGHEVRWYPEIGSTNDVAAAWAEHGAREGCVVVADAQSAGRGRHGRNWASPSGAGLYVSTVLRPAEHVLPLLTIAAGVGVAEGIQAVTGLVADLKWPNDVFINGRKVAGVLAEATSSATGTRVVLGVGINASVAAYPPEVVDLATSLERELGGPVARGHLLAECLCGLAHQYQNLTDGRRDAVLDAWRARAAATLGRRVRWSEGGDTRVGTVDGIDDSGALLVRTDAGQTRVMAGDVRWL